MDDDTTLAITTTPCSQFSKINYSLLKTNILYMMTIEAEKLD
jgi:hypothetical protein